MKTVYFANSYINEQEEPPPLLFNKYKNIYVAQNSSNMRGGHPPKNGKSLSHYGGDESRRGSYI